MKKRSWIFHGAKRCCTTRRKHGWICSGGHVLKAPDRTAVVDCRGSWTYAELDGVSDLSQVLGSVEQNTEVGIFGHMSDALGSRPVEIGSITAGPASILSTVEGHEAQEFQVEINRVYRDSDGTHAMFSVVDPALLSRTGGIVQGMSGSPILQNGRLVGAVTHVFVNDASRGYAVSIQDMLRASGLSLDKAA